MSALKSPEWTIITRHVAGGGCVCMYVCIYTCIDMHTLGRWHWGSNVYACSTWPTRAHIHERVLAMKWKLEFYRVLQPLDRAVLPIVSRQYQRREGSRRNVVGCGRIFCECKLSGQETEGKWIKNCKGLNMLSVWFFYTWLI